MGYEFIYGWGSYMVCVWKIEDCKSMGELQSMTLSTCDAKESYDYITE